MRGVGGVELRAVGVVTANFSLDIKEQAKRPFGPARGASRRGFKV